MFEPFWRRPVYILICATAVVMISVGIRYSFGLFLKPITLELGWEFGLFAALIHWPIDDRPVARLAETA